MESKIPSEAAGVEPATPAPLSEPEASDELPTLPLEVLEMALSSLDDVQDLARLSLSSSEFRQVCYNCEGAWEKAFFRDYTRSAEDYQNLQTWRERYIACTLDITCLKLRDKAEQFDELEDSTAALERAVADIMRALSKVDKSLAEQRFLLNEQLETVADCPSTHSGSKLGRMILEAARGDGTLQEGEGPPWRQRLTPQTCSAIRDAAAGVDHWLAAMAEKKDALRTLMDALSVQQAATKRVHDSIAALRQKRASLEAATAYRHTMRRR